MTATRPDPELVRLLRSVVGEPAPGAPDAAHVARIRARAAQIAAAGQEADDPVTDWLEEVGRLVKASRRSVAEVADELHGLGMGLGGEELVVTLGRRPVCPDRELMRAIVTLFNGDWAGGGYEALYDAAADEQSRLDGSPTASAPRRAPSGLYGSEQLSGRALLAQVRPRVTGLPPVVHGRDGVLARLVGLLDAPSTATQLVVGRGGSGKSTVALAVAVQAQERGHRVWWVTAGDPNQVTRGMLAVATELGAPLSELDLLQSDPARGAERLWRRLQTADRRWLLVFDDADDPDVLRLPGTDPVQRWFRPSEKGTVLVTSRALDGAVWGPDTCLTEIADLEPGPGAQVILDRIRAAGRTADDPRLVAQARAVSQRLGGVALALRNVGDYLASGVARQSMTDLIGSLDAHRLADTHVVTADPRSRIATTWELSLAALSVRGVPEARTLLRLLACYAPGKWVVPLEVIAPERIAATGLPAGGDGSPGRWRAALDGLRAVGLVDRTITAGHGVEGVVVHPLVAEVSLDDRDEQDGGGEDAAGPAGIGPAANGSAAIGPAAIESAAVALLWQAVADLDAGRPDNRPMLRRLEPHVYAVVEAVRSKQSHADALRLADRTAQGLIRAGLFGPGEELIRHARAHSSLGPEDPLLLDTEGTLAWALGLRGELGEATRRLESLVTDRMRISGARHEATLLARDHLAWVLAEQGLLDDAEALLRELLAECDDGSSTVHALAVRHRLAWITALRGRTAKAEAEFRAVLPLRRAVLGDDHMEVFSTRYRLAWSIAIQGRAAEAEGLFVELSRDLGRVTEPGSAPVILVQARLGYVRAIRGRFEEAERDHVAVLAARERLLGPEHPRTLRARHDLAWMLVMKGDLRGAERGYREVLADGKALLGRDHPLTLESRGRLAELLVDTGRLDEADRRLRALAPHRRRFSGPDHPATLISRYNLARVLLARGRYGDAAVHLEAVLADQLRVLGPAHRHVLATRATMAKLRGRLGDLAGADEEIRAVRALAHSLLGPGHPESLAVRQVLVWVLGERGELDEAERECRALLAERMRVLGREHPDTLDTTYRLGWLFGIGDRGREAERLYRGLVETQNRVLGREHPHSLRTRHGLALELLQAGRTAEAEQELRLVLLDRTRTLGRQHPDTLSNRHALAVARAVGGRNEEAIRSLRIVLDEQTRLLGPEHRDTLNTRERLAWAQERRGALDEADAHWRALLEDRERILGPDHPDTRRTRLRLADGSHTVPRIW